MSVVLVIIAVLLAGGAVSFGVSLQKQQERETNQKLQTIQKALYDYWDTFGYIPCPGDLINYNTNQNNFGKIPSSPRICSGTPEATYIYNITSDDTTACVYTGAASELASQNCIYGGLIPVRALGLADDYAFDGWGRRFLYAVDGDFVQVHARSTMSDLTADITNSVERIIVYSSASQVKTSSAGYVLLSFGQNGHGAYGRYTSDITLVRTTPAKGATGEYQLASLDTRLTSPFENRNIVSDAGQSRWLGAPMFQLASSSSSVTIIPAARITSGSEDVQELENCDCAAITAITGTFNNIFYQDKGSSRLFDDILVYATRADLRSATE